MKGGPVTRSSSLPRARGGRSDRGRLHRRFDAPADGGRHARCLSVRGAADRGPDAQCASPPQPDATSPDVGAADPARARRLVHGGSDPRVRADRGRSRGAASRGSVHRGATWRLPRHGPGMPGAPDRGRRGTPLGDPAARPRSPPTSRDRPRSTSAGATVAAGRLIGSGRTWLRLTIGFRQGGSATYYWRLDVPESTVPRSAPSHAHGTLRRASEPSRPGRSPPQPDSWPASRSGVAARRTSSTEPRLDGLPPRRDSVNRRMWRARPRTVPRVRGTWAARADVLGRDARLTARSGSATGARTATAPTWTERTTTALASGGGRSPARTAHSSRRWDPGGGRFAVLAGDLDADPRLTLVDPATGTAVEIDLGQPVAAAPPAWVGADLVAVVTGPDDAPTSILVEREDRRRCHRGRAGARLVATSADGKTVAVARSRRHARSSSAPRRRGWQVVGRRSRSSTRPRQAVAATSLAARRDGRPPGRRLARQSGGTVRIESLRAPRASGSP